MHEMPSTEEKGIGCHINAETRTLTTLSANLALKEIHGA